MRLGRLFWKFFFAFWLALILAGAAVGSAVWWHQQGERNRIEAERDSALAGGPRAAMTVSAAAAVLGHGGVPALRAWLADWPRERLPLLLYVVDGGGHELLGREVTLTDGVTEFAAEKADKASWMTLSVTAKGLGKPVYDRAKVTAWVQKIADETAEPVVNGVNNVSPSGAVLVEAMPGKSGYKANNVDAVAAELISALEAGKPYEGDFKYDEIKPKYETQPALPGYEKFAYPAAEGERWIDVNLTTYQMVPYIGQTPAREPSLIVPGKPGEETITGTFHVYLQYRAQDMGCSSRFSYCARNVPWVSYFSGDYALHGAPWQPFFGPGAPGSMGCVNLPADAAEFVYNWV